MFDMLYENCYMLFLFVICYFRGLESLLNIWGYMKIFRQLCKGAITRDVAIHEMGLDLGLYSNFVLRSLNTCAIQYVEQSLIFAALKGL